MSVDVTVPAQGPVRSATTKTKGWYWPLIVVVCTLPLESHSAAPSKTLRRRTTETSETVQCMSFSPDAKTLAVGSSAPSLQKGDFPGDRPLPEGTIELWDLNAESLTATLRQSAKTANGDSLNKVGAIVFSPDGKWLIGGDVRGYALWEVVTGRQKLNWRAGMIEPLSPAWSPDGKWIALPTMVDPQAPAYESSPWGVGLVDAVTGTAKMFVPVEIGYPRSARFSPDGKLIATAGHDCKVRVFDTQTRTNIFTDDVQTTLFAVGFSPDGRTLVAGSTWGGVLLLYDVISEDGKFTISKKGTSSQKTGEEIHLVQFTPDGNHALSLSPRASLRLWNATDWTTVALVGECTSGCLSPDGSKVAFCREKAPNLIEVWSLPEFMRAFRGTHSPLETLMNSRKPLPLAPTTAARNECLSNLNRVHAAKQIWAVEKKKETTETPEWSDLQPYFGATGWVAKCPSGGTYAIGTVATKPKCSTVGHLLQ
jgi:WD40 repeat protein